jgi:hypothetical protein
MAANAITASTIRKTRLRRIGRSPFAPLRLRLNHLPVDARVNKIRPARTARLLNNHARVKAMRAAIKVATAWFQHEFATQALI